MSGAALVRVGGIAAIIGGMLRVVASFTPGVGSDTEQQMLYLVADMFLLLGLKTSDEQVGSDSCWRFSACSWSGRVASYVDSICIR